MSSSAGRLLGNFPSAQVSSALSRSVIAPSAGNSATAGMDLISTVVLTAVASDITFSIPSTYSHLQVMGATRGAGSAYRYGHIYLRFNGDGGTNYRNMKTAYYDDSVQTVVSNFSTYNGTSADFGHYTDGWGGLKLFSTFMFDIPFIQDANYKTAIGWTTHTLGENSTSGAWSGYDAFVHSTGYISYLSTNPITSVTIGNYGSSWEIGSQFTVMGIRR
jgi:hypothetical protein